MWRSHVYTLTYCSWERYCVNKHLNVGQEASLLWLSLKSGLESSPMRFSYNWVTETQSIPSWITIPNPICLPFNLLWHSYKTCQTAAKDHWFSVVIPYRPAKENLSKFTAAAQYVHSVARRRRRRRGDAKLPRVSNWGYRIHCGYRTLTRGVPRALGDNAWGCPHRGKPDSPWHRTNVHAKKSK